MEVAVREARSWRISMCVLHNVIMRRRASVDCVWRKRNENDGNKRLKSGTPFAPKGHTCKHDLQ